MNVLLIGYPFSTTIEVYKLVRFYEPSSQAQYQTTRATLTVFSAFMSFDMTADCLKKPVAIVAFILLIGTFAVGLRCFADFDRGLQTSKVNCKALVFFRLAIRTSFLFQLSLVGQNLPVKRPARIKHTHQGPH